MADPSEDEIIVLIVSGIASVVSSISWCTATFSPWRQRRTVSRFVLLLFPIFAWISLWVILRTLASADVRNEPFYYLGGSIVYRFAFEE